MWGRGGCGGSRRDRVGLGIPWRPTALLRPPPPSPTDLGMYLGWGSWDLGGGGALILWLGWGEEGWSQGVSWGYGGKEGSWGV